MSEQLRYSDAELEEFRQIILAKIETATALYEELCASLRNNEGNDIADTSPTFKTLEEGASTLEREANARLAERQRQFIGHLRKALGSPALGAGENHILHPFPPEGLGGLLSQHPAHRVADIAFAASVGADYASQSPAKGDAGFIRERLEPLYVQIF